MRLVKIACFNKLLHNCIDLPGESSRTSFFEWERGEVLRRSINDVSCTMGDGGVKPKLDEFECLGFHSLGFTGAQSFISEANKF